jgi:predicted nucleic acid-binding protein
MSGRFFLDTNVFVYEFDTRDLNKTDRASQLIRSAIFSKRGIVSYQVVQEFFSVAFTRFAKPLDLPSAEEYFSTIFKPLLAVHSSPRLFVDALRIHKENRFSWYDSLIVAAAQQAKCSILYSEDMQDGRRIDDLKIENPFRQMAEK